MQTAIDKAPQVAYWSSSPDLSSSAFTHFSRTYASDAVAASLLVEVVASQGWRSVGVVILGGDGWADNYLRSFRSAAQTRGTVEVAVAASFEDEFKSVASHPSSARSALLTLRSAGVNVIVAVVYDLPSLLQAAEGLGMLSSEHVWIVVDHATVQFPGQSAAAARRQLHGLLTFQPSPVFEAGYARFAQKWAASAPADCANSVVSVGAPLFASPPDAVAAYAYDGVAALALALGAAAPSVDGDVVQMAMRARPSYI